MLSPPDPWSSTTLSSSSSLSHLFRTTFSYDGNIMLAAIVLLLLVILFVLLLHLYAKWFLEQARQRRRRNSMSVSHVLGPTGFHHFHTLTFDTTLSTSATKGLDPSIITSIPLFVYKSNEHKQDLECVICLSLFEDNDVGRNLPKCGHAFHVQCIDMWLHSHSNCPLCRAPVVCDHKMVTSVVNDEVLEDGNRELSEVASVDDEDSSLEIVIEVPGSDIVAMNDYLSASSSSLSSSSSSQSSQLGCSLKRMLSRNRSEPKIYPSSNVNEFEA